MANGDIPITGSAPLNPNDPNATFAIAYDDDGFPDARNHMLVRTRGAALHIHVDNGAGKIFDEDLAPTGWTLKITPR